MFTCVCVRSPGPGIARPLFQDVGVAVGVESGVWALQMFIPSLERDSRFTV